MSKHALVGILVLCFVSTFLTMIYQYAKNGSAHESNPPITAGHHGAAHGAPTHTQTPSPEVVMTPMVSATPLVVETPSMTESATPVSEAPVTTATP